MTTGRAAQPALLRVMHVIQHDAAAGTELMIATLAEGSAALGITPVVVILDEPGVVARRLSAAGVAVHSLGAAGPTRSLVRLARVVRASRPQVICGYGFRTGLATRLAARVLRPRARTVTGVRGLYVTEIESLDTARGRIVMGIERATAPLVDAYVANSPGAVEVLAAHGVARDRLHLVPNGIDAAAWPATDLAARSADRTPVVLCVGRFSAVKRQIDLVDAAAQLRSTGVGVRLVFAGDGPLRESVAAHVRALGLESSVSLLGAVTRERLRELLAEADIATLVSTQEGMPGSVMEAMASGLPVVGTDVNGVRDLVVHGQTGLLVPPRDPAALAGALRELIVDPARRAALGAAGRERIVRDFSLAGMTAQTAAIHRALLAAPGRGAAGRIRRAR